MDAEAASADSKKASRECVAEVKLKRKLDDAGLIL